MLPSVVSSAKVAVIKGSPLARLQGSEWHVVSSLENAVPIAPLSQPRGKVSFVILDHFRVLLQVTRELMFVKNIRRFCRGKIYPDRLNRFINKKEM